MQEVRIIQDSFDQDIAHVYSSIKAAGRTRWLLVASMHKDSLEELLGKEAGDYLDTYDDIEVLVAGHVKNKED